MNWDRLHGVSLFTLVSAALAVSSPYFVPALVWIPLACALGGTALLLTHRVNEDRALTRIVGSSFAIRCVLAVVLFAISSLKLPILPSLRVAHGLWAFGVDGVGYHEEAVTILDAWHTGIDLPSVLQTPQALSLPVAMVYAVFGTSPLNFILVNAWFGAMCGLLAYLIAVRLGDNRNSALAAAGLVAFWPSSLLWSTQLLKDPAMCALVLSALFLLVAVWQRYSSLPHRPRVAWDFALWAGLAAAVFGLTFIRENLGLILFGSVAGVMTVSIVGALLHRWWKEAIVAAGIAALVGAATLSGRSLDLALLLSPRHPEVGHLARGNAFRDRGQSPSAVAAYRRAIELNPRFAPAYRALGLTLIGQSDRDGAMSAFNRYLELETDERQRDSAKRAMALAIGPKTPEETATSTAPTTSDASTMSIPMADAIAKSAQPPAHSVISAISAGFRSELRASLAWLSVDTIVGLRQVQVSYAGGQLVDAVTFKGPGDFIAYLPRALANAYLAPFPWQLVSTSGYTGVMRPFAMFEIALIALLLPSIVRGFWQRLTHFRPEEWLFIVFILSVALAYGLMMPNGGTLFRSRLQFLLPTLVLAASALPAFVYRLFGASESPAGVG